MPGTRRFDAGSLTVGSGGVGSSEIVSASPQLASNVSSFAVCNDFLLLTTHSHCCRCLRLSTLTLKGEPRCSAPASLWLMDVALNDL